MNKFIRHTKTAWIAILVVLIFQLLYLVLQKPIDIERLTYSEIATHTIWYLFQIAAYTVILIWFALLLQNCKQGSPLKSPAILGIIGATLKIIAASAFAINQWVYFQSFIHMDIDQYQYLILERYVLVNRIFFYAELIAYIVIAVAFIILATKLKGGVRGFAISLAVVLILIPVLSYLFDVLLMPSIQRLILESYDYSDEAQKAITTIYSCKNAIYILFIYGCFILFFSSFHSTIKNLSPAKPKNDPQPLQ